MEDYSKHNNKQIVIISLEDDLKRFFKFSFKEALNEHKDSIPQVDSEDDLLTIKQLSKFFQVSETTIHKWKNDGIIPYIRVNSRIRFKKSEILKLKEKRRSKRNDK